MKVPVPSLSLRRQRIPLLLAASGWIVLGVTALGSPERSGSLRSLLSLSSARE